MNTNVSPFTTIDLDQLTDVTGAIDWGRVWESTKQGAADYGMGGTIVGAAMGSLAPGVGTLTGAGAGGLIGLGGGGGGGAGTGASRPNELTDARRASSRRFRSA